MTRATIHITASGFTDSPGPRALYGDRPASKVLGYVYSITTENGYRDDWKVFESVDEAASAARREAIKAGYENYSIYEPSKKTGVLYAWYADERDYRRNVE